MLLRYGEAETILTSDCILSSSNSSSASTTNVPVGSASSTAGTASTGANTGISNSNSGSSLSTGCSKNKLHEEIIKEYGAEYSSYVLQILATVYL